MNVHSFRLSIVNCQINVGEKAQPSGVLRAESITLHSTEAFNDMPAMRAQTMAHFLLVYFFSIKTLEEGSEFLK